MRVAAPLRTILDVAEAGTAPEQVILAGTQAQERGMIVVPHLRQAAQWREQRIKQLIAQVLSESS